MYELAWREINKAGNIVTKRKEFKTKEAMDKHIDKLCESGNLYEIYGTRGPEDR